MALFGKKESQATSKSDKISSATIITSCMKVTGNLQGTDTIHIDGHVIGNITVSNTLVIGRTGIVEGEVEAKHIIINGELKGKVKCEDMEVMQTGRVSHTVEAKHLILDGIIDGDITATESIKVLENSDIHATNFKSKIIIVHGKVQGTIIATELLEIGSKGFVEGQITMKNIKTEEGGRMIGTMSTYQEDPKSKSTKKEKPKKAATKDGEDNFFT